MSLFGLGAVLLVLLAVAFIAGPLRRAAVGAPLGDLRRAGNLEAWREARAELELQRQQGRIDAAEQARAQRELDRRLLAETDAPVHGVNDASGGRRALLLGMLLVPLAAVMLYAALGAHSQVELNAALAALERIEDPAGRSTRLVALLPQLEAAARGRDEEGQYRFLLARSYMTLGRYAEAAAYYEALTTEYPQDAGLLAQQAQALYLAGGRVLSPAVQALIDRALAIDPAQITLLGMVGMDRFQAGDFAGAIATWEKLLSQLPADAPDAAVIRDGIAMARARAGGGELVAEHAAQSAGAVAAVQGGDASTAPADASGLRVAVSIAEGLQVPAEGTVFVFARAVNGPPMPLAVARFAVDELPREVRLDDSMAMAPGMKLSLFDQVTVTARISRSGTVTAAPGDAEGSSGPLQRRRGEQAVVVRVDRLL
jgi:cytochrome c-type biogenesis protein CcmH